MSVLDTSIVVEKIKNKIEIYENVTEISILEYPPILDYEKFFGTIYNLKKIDLEVALELQLKLRRIGKPQSVPDLLIAAICINRNEELITKDKDFLNIAKVSNLKVKVIK